MTSSAVRDQVVAQLKKAMDKAYRQKRECDAESIKAEIDRLEKGRAA